MQPDPRRRQVRKTQAPLRVWGIAGATRRTRGSQPRFRSTAWRALCLAGGLGVRTPGPAAPARRARRRRPRPGPRSGRTAARPSKLPPGPERGRGAGRPSRAGTGDGPVDNRVRKTARKNNVQVLATPHGWDGLNGFARAANENTDGWLVRSDNDAYGFRTIEYAAEELLTAAQRDVEAR